MADVFRQINMINPEMKIAGKHKLDFSISFKSLSLFRTGPQAHETKNEVNCLSAKFDLNCSQAEIFPYINAEIHGAKYYSQPECIKFMFDDRLCILYPEEGAFTPVDNHADAADFLRTLLEFISDTAGKKEKITPNFRTYNAASPLDIFKLLPGNNCKECGYGTCLAFAAALSRQHTTQVKCPYLPNPVDEKSTFKVVDKKGKEVRTVSLAIDTNCLQREISEKEAYIEKLQIRLAEFERSRVDSIEKNNARLLSPLTAREIEVLEMVAQGATNKEISQEMNISEHTVKSHVIHIFDKLGVNDRAQASVWAAKNGLI